MTDWQAESEQWEHNYWSLSSVIAEMARMSEHVRRENERLLKVNAELHNILDNGCMLQVTAQGPDGPITQRARVQAIQDTNEEEKT